MERKVKLKSLQAVFETLGFVVVRFDSVSCAAFGALGLNWNNWIIGPFTCSFTCVRFVFSTTLTLYWACVMTEKLFSLMSFNETVLLTPNKVSFFPSYYFTVVFNSVRLRSMPCFRVWNWDDSPRHKLPVESSNLTVSDDNLTARCLGIDT